MRAVRVFSIASMWSDMCLDVTDVAWSPGDRYLASVGLDSQVIVWCGYTLGISLQLGSIQLSNFVPRATA